MLELVNQFLGIDSWPPYTSTNMGSSLPGHRLAESIPWNRFLGLIKYLKILPLFVFPFLKVLVKKYRNSVNFFSTLIRVGATFSEDKRSNEIETV